MANQILKYTSKDYDSIKKDLIDAISSLTSTWTSREESDPGIVLVKLMSALGDMLSFNHDKQALEYYAPTVTQRKNAEKLFALVGYKMHWYQAAKTTVTLTNLAQMPEYIYFCKRAFDVQTAIDAGDIPEESFVDIYFDYRTRYGHNASDTLNLSISIPPITVANGSAIPMPTSMVDAGILRPTLSINTEPLDKEDNLFQYNATHFFATNAVLVYNYWKQDSMLGLHTYICDKNLAIEIYPREYGAIPYSLIPTTVNPGVQQNNSDYNPTIQLLPYEPKEFTAIQGSLRSVSFRGTKLRDNCYYVPDSMLDETYMYLSYVTVENGIQSQVPVFIEKTDNLLTVTNFNNADGTTKIYFQFAVDEFDYPYIELSSYWSDILNSDSVTFTFYYFKTLGNSGNITTNYLARLNSASPIDLSVTNLSNTDYMLDANGNYLTAPGKNPQTAYDAYVDSINYIMTYDTLVTIYDFTRFARRQDGITNAFACDGQYAKDLNKKIDAICNSYTKQQLLDILGENADDTLSQSELAQILGNIRHITYYYRDANITIAQSLNPISPTSFKNYGLNICPIWGNYLLVNQASGVAVAKYSNQIDSAGSGTTVYSPYYIYSINTEAEVGSSNPDAYAVETMLDNAIDKTRIVNVRPEYTGLRVFPWRCCGTLHLTQVVTQQEADNILKSVVSNLATTYKPENMTLGKKLTYMEVIDTVLASDPRIRYFDAGIGTKKLIDFEISQMTTQVYNTEAYFNPMSIMRYVQTYNELLDSTSPYYNMIYIDPNYIQTN
jgi:hypothetical protein